MANKTFFNDYGFIEHTPTLIKSDVRGIPDKTIYDIYTITEQTRDWRKMIKQHVINEHEDTREIVDNWTTDETNRAINTIDAHTTSEVDHTESVILNSIDVKTNNVINTLSPKIADVKTEVSGIRSVVNAINANVSSIQSQLNNIRSTYEQVNNGSL